MKKKLGTDILGAVNSASLLDPGLLNWDVFLDWKSVANHSQPAVRKTEGKNQESPCLSLSLGSCDMGQCCPAFHSEGEGGELNTLGLWAPSESVTRHLILKSQSEL